MNKKGIFIIKCGGSVLEQLSESFFESISLLHSQGERIVIVHGGGPAINRTVQQMQLHTEMVNGLRKTTDEVLDVVDMVLCGKMNKQLVRMLQKSGLKSVGLSGSDGGMFTAVPHKDKDTLGWVGEIGSVDGTIVETLLDKGYVVVVSPITTDCNGQVYNINADTAASQLASALGATSMLFVTDVPGILKEGILIPEISQEGIAELVADGTIYGGMIPKVEGALQSLQGAIEEVRIVSGKERWYTATGFHGTVIVNSQTQNVG
ncbi:MAG: acetylglutamate kinase [Bacilli bacterium]